MQETEYQYWVREEERLLRSHAKAVCLEEEIPPFSMAYQPVLDVMSGGTYAFEALVRSMSGASAYSVLSRVSHANIHVFDRACRSHAIRSAMGHGLLTRPDVKLSINVNPNAALADRSHLTLTCEEAVQIGFPLDRLILELVEDEEICNFDELNRMVADYRDCGVQIAMDDFGAGYSGLKLLTRLNPDIIKIDMELISRIGEDRTSKVIVGAIVNACNELGITIVAEGVETYETAMRLRDMGVALQQGYYFARPGFETLPDVHCKLPQTADWLARDR